MPRISGRCTACGAGLAPADIRARPFRCPQCGAWLRVPLLQQEFRSLLAALCAGLAAYGLGFRGAAFVMALLIGLVVLSVPVCRLLDWFVPLRPKRASPDFLTLDLRVPNDRRSNRDKPGADKG
jgi:hypothetical protein